MMTVNEAIEQLQAMQANGHGDAKIKIYSELSYFVYPEAEFVLRINENYAGEHDSETGANYGIWVEVR